MADVSPELKDELTESVNGIMQIMLESYRREVIDACAAVAEEAITIGYDPVKAILLMKGKEQ